MDGVAVKPHAVEKIEKEMMDTSKNEPDQYTKFRFAPSIKVLLARDTIMMVVYVSMMGNATTNDKTHDNEKMTVNQQHASENEATKSAPGTSLSWLTNATMTSPPKMSAEMMMSMAMEFTIIKARSEITRDPVKIDVQIANDVKIAFLVMEPLDSRSFVIVVHHHPVAGPSFTAST